jgi:hypothetical protein
MVDRGAGAPVLYEVAVVVIPRTWFPRNLERFERLTQHLEILTVRTVGRSASILVSEFKEFVGKAPYAAPLENAARHSSFTEGALIAVSDVASVRYYAGLGADSTQPAVRFRTRRPGPSEVGEDNVRLELMGELGAEHHVCGLADHPYAWDQRQALGEQGRYAGVLVDNQHCHFGFLDHAIRVTRGEVRT